MKRIGSLLLSAMLLMMCFGAKADEDTINWMHHYGEESARAWVDEVASIFTEQTGVKIDVLAVGSDSFETVLKTKIAGSDAPDIYFLESVQIPNYVKNGYLADLSGLAFWDSLTEGTAENTQIDGKNYFLPFEFSTAGVFYNMDVFEAAGIETLPQTHSEFMAILQKLKDCGVTPIAYGSQERWTITNDFRCSIATILKTNANYINEMEARQIKFADDALMKDLLEKFKARYAFGNADPFGTDWNKATQMVANGEAAMVINGNWASGAIQEKKPGVRVGAFAVPDTDNAEDTTMTVWMSAGFTIFEDSPVKEQCIAFFNTLASKESGNFWMKECGRLSSIMGLDQSDDNAINAINQYLDSGKIFNTSSLTPNFNGEYKEAFLDVLTLYLMDEIQDVNDVATELDTRFDEVHLKLS